MGKGILRDRQGGRGIKMTDIELVIKIPEESYKATCNGCMLPPDVENVVNAIKNGTPLSEQSKWIFINERLPNNHEYIKNNGLFNVSDGNRSYFGWFDIYDTKKFVKPTIAGFRVDNAVIAWMPLPEPYKVESEVRDANSD